MRQKTSTPRSAPRRPAKPPSSFGQSVALLGSIVACVTLFIAPLKWGLYVSPQEAIAPANPLEWIFFSWPSWTLHIAIALTAACALLAFVAGERRILKNTPALLGVCGWAALFFFMRRADMNLPREWQAPLVPRQFALYGLWFFAVCILPVSRRLAPYAIVVLLSVTLFVSFSAARQHHGGLEQIRVYVAEAEGFDSFADYTNAVLSVSHDYDTWLHVNKLASPRVFGTFVYPNALAGFLLIALLLGAAFFLGYTASPVLRIFGAIASVCAGYALMLSRSKAVIVLAAIGLIWLLVRMRLARKIARIPATLAALCVCVCAILFLTWGYGPQLGERLHSTSFARKDYWRAAANMIAQKPLSGWGTGSFSRYYAVHRPTDAEPTRLPHNVFLNVGADYGLWAVLSLIVALGVPLGAAAIGALFSSRATWIGTACALAALLSLLHWCGDFGFHVGGIVLPALFCLAAAQFAEDLDDEKPLSTQ